MAAPIVAERKGRVARITLNRPEAGNRIAMPGVFQLMKAVLEAGHSEAQVIHLRAIGADFCTGLEAAPGADKFDALTLREQVIEPIQSLYEAIARVQTPVVASVQGRASGLGLALVAAADVVLAAEDARFQLAGHDAETPSILEIAALLQRVPAKAIGWLAYSGDAIDAAAAQAMGLVSRIVPGGVLDSTADAFAERLATRPRETTGGVKHFMRVAGGLDRAALADLAANVLATIGSSKHRAAPHSHTH